MEARQREGQGAGWRIKLEQAVRPRGIKHNRGREQERATENRKKREQDRKELQGWAGRRRDEHLGTGHGARMGKRGVTSRTRVVKTQEQG